MAIVTLARFCRIPGETGWDLKGQVRDVYDCFRFRNGRAPRICTWGDGGSTLIKKTLIKWKAHRGGRVDWTGFLAQHHKILAPLARLRRPLGRLTAEQIDLVCKVVEQLDSFKKARSRRFVFGSKAAHFHFPGLVPVMSSEVRQGLKEIQSRGLAGSLRFAFTSERKRAEAYRNYVALGNREMRNVNSRRFLRGKTRAAYALHAKIFEWCIISYKSGVG